MMRIDRATVAAAAIAGLPLAVLGLVSGLHWAITVGLFLVVAVVSVALVPLLGRGRADRPDRLPRTRVVASAFVGFLAVALLIQLVPYGRDRSNPAVVLEPTWDSERTRELAVKACFDCHSNEVDYPWYASIAPVSWAVQGHVDKGRSALNFSQWDRPPREAHEAAETVQEGSMPPWYYNLTHATLTDAEKRDLISGLEATLGESERSDFGDFGRGDREEDDD